MNLGVFLLNDWISCGELLEVGTNGRFAYYVEYEASTCVDISEVFAIMPDVGVTRSLKGLLEECSLVSWMIAMSIFSSSISCCHSAILFCIPFRWICRTVRLSVLLDLECAVFDDGDSAASRATMTSAPCDGDETFCSVGVATWWTIGVATISSTSDLRFRLWSGEV